MERPPADPAKLLAAVGEWETGETLPGRTMSTLKTGGLRDLLEHHAGEAGTEAPGGADATALLASWMAWETGDSTPADVMAGLAEGGLRRLLAALADPGVETGAGR